MTGCGIDSGEEGNPLSPMGRPERSSREIVGGVTDLEDPAVVQIKVGEFVCSGTLIAPRTVLTAAHCIDAKSRSSVLFGSRASSPVRVVAVAQQFKNPSFQEEVGHDVGVLKLEEAVTDVQPIPLNTTALTQADIGRNIRHVGFGLSDGTRQTGIGIKRQVTYPIRSVSSLQLESGAQGQQTCNGDSGGPGFGVTAGSTRERVIGIVSNGDETCIKDGFDTRVDKDVAFIIDTASAWEKIGTCKADTVCVEGCVPVDADCVAVGAPCSTKTQCASGQCIDDPQHPVTYCSQACSASSPCPAAMECFSGTCRFVQLAPVGLGQSCDAQSLCEEGTVCAEVASAQAVCAPSCSSDGTCSQPSSACVSDLNGLRFCQARAPQSPLVPAPDREGLGYGRGNAAGAEDRDVVGGCGQAGGGLWLWGGILLGPLLLSRRSRLHR